MVELLWADTGVVAAASSSASAGTDGVPYMNICATKRSDVISVSALGSITLHLVRSRRRLISQGWTVGSRPGSVRLDNWFKDWFRRAGQLVRDLVKGHTFRC